jgi:hypothetical protein
MFAGAISSGPRFLRYLISGQDPLRIASMQGFACESAPLAISHELRSSDHLSSLNSLRSTS